MTLYQVALRLSSKMSYQFRTIYEAKALANLLGSICAESERSRFGLYELLVNAVEHGNLGISYEEKTRFLLENRWEQELATRYHCPLYKDRIVSVDVEQAAEGFFVLITDQGNGFSHESYLDFSLERVFDLHGKGIAMAKNIYLDGLEYLGKGNQVRAFIQAACPMGKS